MDNGLIFPYRRFNDPAEAVDAKHVRPAAAFGWWRVECVTLDGVRQAAEGRRKVAHPGRWLSRAKCVGWGVGKSVPRVPET